MTFQLQLALVPDSIFQNQMDRIERLLIQILAQEKITMTDLSALQAEVQRNTDVEKSALALIQGLAAQLEAAGTDPQKLADLQAQLKANDDALAAAVAANTPASGGTGGTGGTGTPSA